MSGGAADRAERPVSFGAPFRHVAFTVIWTATLVSNVGGWMYSAASAWLMTSLEPFRLRGGELRHSLRAGPPMLTKSPH